MQVFEWRSTLALNDARGIVISGSGASHTPHSGKEWKFKKTVTIRLSETDIQKQKNKHNGNHRPAYRSANSIPSPAEGLVTCILGTGLDDRLLHPPLGRARMEGANPIPNPIKPRLPTGSSRCRFSSSSSNRTWCSLISCSQGSDEREWSLWRRTMGMQAAKIARVRRRPFRREKRWKSSGEVIWSNPTAFHC